MDNIKNPFILIVQCALHGLMYGALAGTVSGLFVYVIGALYGLPIGGIFGLLFGFVNGVVLAIAQKWMGLTHDTLAEANTRRVICLLTSAMLHVIISTFCYQQSIFAFFVAMAAIPGITCCAIVLANWVTANHTTPAHRYYVAPAVDDSNVWPPAPRTGR